MKFIAGILTILYVTFLSLVVALSSVFLSNVKERAVEKIEPNTIIAPQSINLGKFAKKRAGYILPLKALLGQRYCSTSAVQYKGKVYTVTNEHCCSVPMPFGRKVRRVGDTLQTILHISQTHDVCILTSALKSSPIKLAKSDFEYMDEAIILGYPRGEDYTPRQGYVLSLNEYTAVQYSWDDVRIRPSHSISFLTFPGNSGSPVFNSRGRLVNLLYAGSNPVNSVGITVPLRFIKEALEIASK